MPWRLKRYAGRGDLHFITFSCYQRRKFLASSESKDHFVTVLGEVRQQLGFRLAGYVVMPEHVHLLIEETAAILPARVVQVLKQRVSRALRTYNSSLAKWPRFWQTRYFDFNVYSEVKLREKLDYMHLNPVRRGLVGRAVDWIWSSARWYLLGKTVGIPIRMPEL